MVQTAIPTERESSVEPASTSSFGSATLPNNFIEERDYTADKKRSNYLDWNEYFMVLAKVTAERSKDPHTQVGCCIVQENKVIGLGYNGFPRGCSDDKFPWGKGNSNPLKNKHMYVVHAEQNAILNSTEMKSLKGATIYTTLFPCNECAKTIVQVGISEVIFFEDRNSDEFNASRIIFDSVGVTYKKFKPSSREFVKVSLH